MVFNAVWTMLVLVYLGIVPRFLSRYAHVHAMTALDAVTMIFWFAGFIALAVLYHDIVGVARYEYFAACGALGDYCGVTEAAVVFGALEWYVCPFRLFVGDSRQRELILRSFPSGFVFDRYCCSWNAILTAVFYAGYFSWPRLFYQRWIRPAAVANTTPNPQLLPPLEKNVLCRKKVVLQRGFKN